MTKSYSTLMKSRFFTPAFNSAIFDGPIRIYFAQFNESEALKIYFAIQDRFSERIARLKDRIGSKNIFVLLYPNADTFNMSFNQCDRMFRREQLEGDEIIGVCGPNEYLEPVYEFVETIVSEWELEFPTMHTEVEATL